MAHQLSPLLSLPREIRDIIYAYSITPDRYSDREVRTWPNYRIKRIPIGSADRWTWEAHHTTTAPFPEYLSLMLVNRQFHAEMLEFLSGPRAPAPVAKVELLLEYPKLFTLFTSIPHPPQQIREIDLLVRINHIFHPAYITRGSQNAILSAISDTLKRYIYRGPHLARPSPLPLRLHIETVRITVAALSPFEDMKDEYGFVEPQVATLYENFMGLLRRFCRSGLPWGAIDAFDVRMDGRGWERVFTTSNIWDEEDFIFFQYGGFNWDAGDTVVVQPDQVAW